MSSSMLCRVLIVTMIGALFAGGAYAIEWDADLGAALKRAGAEGKPVMADFSTSWCSWCRKLEEDTFSDRDVDRLSSSFVCVKVDGDRHGRLVRKYRVRGYPTVIFLDPSGRELDRIPGYLGPSDFLPRMKRALRVVRPADMRVKGRTPAGSPVPGYRLEGVIQDGVATRAIINGEIVAPGGSIGGARLERIEATRVYLDIGGKKVVLDISD